MIVIPGLSQPLKAAGKRITSWAEDSDGLTVEADSTVRGATCPSCSERSCRLHGHYRRGLADNPSFGMPVRLDVEMRRFKCVNRHCAQRTFSERIDCLAAVRRRRTLRLMQGVRALGYALGGQAAARLGGKLGMPVSGSMVLSELRRAGCPTVEESPVIVGIDDWAISRGHHYGTIMVDLQRRCPIELVDGRDTASVIPWLEKHPAIEVIARDRASAYADAARKAAPNAQQIADRWHLMSNMCEAIERLLLRHSGKLREAARLVSEAMRLGAQPAGVASETDGAPSTAPRLRSWQRLGVERRAVRLARYEEVMRRREQGERLKSIARSMRIAYATVRSFARAGSFPERAQWSRRPTLLDAYRPYLVSRVAEGCWNAMELWRELRERGFTGCHGAVRNAIARIRRDARADGPRLHAVAIGVQAMGVPSIQRACAWLLGSKERGFVGPEPQHRKRFVETLCRIEPSIEKARGLAQRFLGFIHRKDLAGFDRWLPRAQACAVPELRRFAAKLKEDLSAVRAAFSSPWSSGQVEGQINRLKYLKRQMYGRAKLDLLRIRVLHPN